MIRTYNILVAKCEKREPLPRVWCRWRDKIKMERGYNLGH
jgi:hypothetical protein